MIDEMPNEPANEYTQPAAEIFPPETPTEAAYGYPDYSNSFNEFLQSMTGGASTSSSGATNTPPIVNNSESLVDKAMTGMKDFWKTTDPKGQSQILAMLGMGVAGLAAVPGQKRKEDRENRAIDIRQQEASDAERQRENARTSTGDALAKYKMPELTYTAPKYNGLLANMTPQGK